MRWKFLIPAVVLLTLVKSSHAGWMRTYEVGFFSIAYSVRQTPDSGYIVVGEICEEDGNDGDLLLIKTDSAGDTLWTKLYGGGATMRGTAFNRQKMEDIS
jgi:hypothetical protein